MSRTEQKPKIEDLRQQCRHHYMCSCGADKCYATYGFCTEENCPAFDDESPVPIEMLATKDAAISGGQEARKR